jgi:D-amino-acid oxidase
VSVDAVIVGAGVIGLTTGIVLADAGLDVQVLTADDPRATTSVLATAMVGPTFGFGGPRQDRWAEVTIEELTARPAPGVHLCRGRFVARPAGFIPPGAETLPGFALCAPSELPGGYETGFWADILLIDMPPYLEHLVDRFTAAGGEIVHTRIASLEEAGRAAPRVAHCSGMGARELAPDDDIVPLRGPKIVVENPGLDTFLIEGPPGPEGTSYHPHGDIVVLGGSVRESDDTTPDPDEEAAIIARCVAVEPRLRGARVLEHRVGLRPGRPEVRLDLEDRDGTRVVHNYGHGGLGVTLAWGCAREAADVLMQ